MTDGQLRSARLAMPFQGVRSVDPPGDVVALARAYATKMRSDAAFCGETAARLWGVPMPGSTDDSVVHVSTPHGRARPTGRGVRGSHHDPGQVLTTMLDGVRVFSPVDTWLSLARVLGFADLVAAADFLVTAAFGSTRPPFATLDELRRAASRPRVPGRPLLARAAALAMSGPLSRPESLSRVLFVSAGIPAPVANLRINPLVTLDLAWEGARFGYEYLGDQHRSASQFARDVRRREVVAEDGWGLLEATREDLFIHPHQLVARLRSRLSARGVPLRHVHPSKYVLPAP